MNRKIFAVCVGIFAACMALYATARVRAKDRDGQHRWPRITQAIDDHERVILRGNTRPEANAKNDRGRVADDLAMEHMLMLLKRSPEQEADLEQYLSTLDVKGSANYHQFLTAAQFGAQYGVDPADITMVTGWLAQHGFAVNVVYENGMLIDFSGTARQVAEAFHTEIHYVEARGQRHIANMSDPQIPAALQPVVTGIVSLHNFMPHPMLKQSIRPAYTTGTGTFLVVPQDVATIYNINSVFALGISGQNQTIAVVEDTNTFGTSGSGGSSDWTTFRTKLGLSGYSGTFAIVHPAPGTGGQNCSNPGRNGDEGEAILDAEYATAAAPSAAIQVASCADTFTFGGLIAIENLVARSSPPTVISMSYGECEAVNGATNNAAFNTAFQQAVSAGVAIFVSSGDEGAASCDADQSDAESGIAVSGYTSTPYNVSVGGTDFGDTFHGTNSTYWNSTNTSAFGSARSYIREIPWNDSCASVLLASFNGFAQTYGSTGYCDNGGSLTTASGSGGPSGCATGTPSSSTPTVVSGSCAGYLKPSWQSGLFGNPSDGVRDIPDVSLFAANGFWNHYYVVCWSDPTYFGMPGAASCSGAPDTWSGFGGTSVSSPIMAGIQALLVQVHGRFGNPNINYYAIAKQEYGASGSPSCNSSNLPLTARGTVTACVFNDVTEGDMDVNCLTSSTDGGVHNCFFSNGTNGVLSTSNSAYQPAYGANVGWDFGTGIGSVNAFNLIFNSIW